jgi:hypothetical protein
MLKSDDPITSHHRESVAADQQVSMRRSVSLSIGSAVLGTNRRPRHRSRARSTNNHASAARRAPRHAHAHARQNSANEVEAAVDISGDQELLGARALELDR